MAATATPVPFTLTVVRPGLKWSAEAAEKHAKKGSFIRVGGAQVGNRVLSGAERTSWSKTTNPDEYNTIFHTGYRITGTPENVRMALESAGVTPDQVAQILATSIDRTNWQTTMKGEYDKEIASHAALKGTKPVSEGYDWPQIFWFAQNLKSAVIATSGGQQKGPATSPGRARGGESLGEKLRKLAPGKVIDVSNMDLNTGKGIRTVPQPKSAKSGKFGDFRRGVNIISNNLQTYIRALQLAFGADAETTYASEIDLVSKQLSGTPVFAAAPAPFAAQPPRVAPLAAPAVGATLAPVPTFVPAVPAVASPPVATLGGGALPAIPPLGALPAIPL
jgi:hypothetical protein